MDTQTIIASKNDVIAKHGAWTAHNIQLENDLYTIAPRIVGDEVKLRRIVQCVLDLNGGSVEGLRLLDLACLEGLYAIEFAHHKARSLGIEGREANVEKARFAKRALSLDNVDFVQDDARNLSVEKYGQFDIVLCLGLLYHFDAPDVFSFVERLGDVCRKVCIVDTRVCLHPNSSYTYRGKTYTGMKTDEHEHGESREAKLAKLWASLDNETAFWLSRPAVYNLLAHAGFTSVYECNVPAEPDKPVDRVTFVAIKGQPCQLMTAPLMAGKPIDDMPERPRRENSVTIDALRRVSTLMPRNIRRFGKTVMGRDNRLT
jgi:Methyltransferase domain